MYYGDGIEDYHKQILKKKSLYVFLSRYSKKQPLDKIVSKGRSLVLHSLVIHAFMYRPCKHCVLGC